MNEILSRYSDKSADRHDGLSNMECALCGRIVFELDIEQYFAEDSNRRLECCTQCREDFEFDNNVSLESDALTPDVFNLFWAFGVESMRANSGNDKTQ